MHGSTAIINWIVSPFQFLFGWVTWPFRTISSHF